ncbi:MAG: GTPase domain-containing protein [Verrucomicrobiaceae bacterium]|nr:GTPase domain-containing protein [Verrucomicrobiaceae bacterium]
MSDSEKEIVLSLISHTNVGKTALARTLLREDVGEVADSAHVTVVPESYPLIESEGYAARLWDTPGFGSNLAKLAKRLRSSGNPVGWILHQVWDRTRDLSLWCSQEAIRNVQADADVVLYLVDASQPPATIGYVDLEIEIIEWIGKPVLVFLNQTGTPDDARDERNEREWREHLARHSIVKSVSTLDAFTRCWTVEHQILARAAEVLEGGKKEVARRLTEAWIERNLSIFDESVEVIAGLAAFALTDTEPLPPRGLFEKMVSIVKKGESHREFEKIQGAMYQRLAEKTRETVNRLIVLNGLSGESAAELARSSRETLAVKRDVEESVMTVLGGVGSGLLGGLCADLAAGGMTLGGGAIVGMLVGGATTFALARGYNLTQSGQNTVRWTEAHFIDQIQSIVMLYLAISHFGRGRGAWRDTDNNPAHWQQVVETRIQEDAAVWKALWKKGGPSADRESVAERLGKPLRRLLEEVLGELYPQSAPIFKKR